ncbi:hypothetical protein [Streptomyces sp. NPDC088762]|uniref:hypothetical protein n=1 Tax=Streptomyces sp. NPDC088762 TaxID=3365891 RepID=UPI0037F9A54B
MNPDDAGSRVQRSEFEKLLRKQYGRGRFAFEGEGFGRDLGTETATCLVCKQESPKIKDHQAAKLWLAGHDCGAAVPTKASDV